MSAVSGPISAYDRMCWPWPELERALAAGTHRRELTAYLGRSDYRTLAQLAQRAADAPRRHALRVYLLPGILGSQLGRARRGPHPPDVLWLDPMDVIEGRLFALRPRAGAPLRPLGGIVYTYLGLKLRLQAAGFDVRLHDYDWREDLLGLGRSLGARLRADPAERIALIGHSMGGLLARAALAHSGSAAQRIVRVIGLGTPHGGSIAAVQALRGTYPVVLRLAALDRRHNAEQLTAQVFRRLPSLYQLLPRTAGALDLFDAGAWPNGTRPDAKLLAAARGLAGRLAPADERFISIIGFGQRTATGLARVGAQFRYEISALGDGTVPAALARLAGAREYFIECEHSRLPRSRRLAAALADLLLEGRTRRLSTRFTLPRAAGHTFVTDASLRRALTAKIDWHALTGAARRSYLYGLGDAPPQYWPNRNTRGPVRRARARGRSAGPSSRR